MQRWYDEHGWQVDEATGLYRDTATFSGAGSGSAGAALYEELAHANLTDHFGTGRYFLDVASGPVAHDSYVPWSAAYQTRICVDLSNVALAAAKRRLGAHAFCVQANLACLPFPDGSIDGGVSAYTVQHIPEDRQEIAIAELVRVLAPGRHFLIITGIEPPLRHFLFKLLRPVFHKLTYKSKEQVQRLYHLARGPAWWRSTLEKLGVQTEIRTLQIIRPNEYRFFFGNAIWPVKVIRWLEKTMPRLCLPLATSAVITIRKPGM